MTVQSGRGKIIQAGRKSHTHTHTQGPHYREEPGIRRLQERNEETYSTTILAAIDIQHQELRFLETNSTDLTLILSQLAEM